MLPPIFYLVKSATERMIEPTVSIASDARRRKVRTVGFFIDIATDTPIVPPITIPVSMLLVTFITLFDIFPPR